jgi:hypothetical protein
MQIEDGTGKGNKAEVNDENLLRTMCIDISEEHHVNKEHAQAYHMVFTCSGIINNTPFLYIKNLDDVDMVVEGFRLHTPCNAIVMVVKEPTVTTVLGNENTPANVNVGAGLTADGTFYTAMSGAISGVTGGTVVDRVYYCSGCGDTHTNFEMDIIIQKNKDLAWYTECCSGCNIAGTVPFYYHNEG